MRSNECNTTLCVTSDKNLFHVLKICTVIRNSKNISAYKSNSMRQKILTEQKKYKIELINKSNIYHINEIAMWRLCLLFVFNHFNL